MIRNAFRKELAEILTAWQADRMPVIRRSLADAWLYATDLPGLYNGEIPTALTAELISAGWEYTQDGNWLLLRKKAKEPPEDWYAGPFGQEAASCLSLLERHSAGNNVPSEAEQRILIKAGEEGKTAYENACGALHQDWAERLREGRSLPALSRRYFKK